VVKQHVGSDHLGNNYYIIPEQKTWTGRIVRSKRIVEATRSDYLDSTIPNEWDAWIRGRRKDPPSIEELLKTERYRELIKEKAREVEEKDQALQAKEYEEGLISRPTQTVVKGHASTASFGKQQLSEEPVSTAGNFQPGSWMPNTEKEPVSTAKKKPISTGKPSTDETFQPGSWMPNANKEPVSTGEPSTDNTFQPGSWMPNSKTESDSMDKTFQPASWTPNVKK